MRRVYAVLAVLISAAVIVPPAQAAKTYRFKLTVAVYQDVTWKQHFRDNAWCGQDYHQDYQGQGGGTLEGKLRGARVTFRVRQGILQSSAFRVPATREATNTWDVKWVGIPEEDCPPDLPPATPPDTSQCGKEVAGKLDSQLMVIGGRLGLLAAFDPAGSPDPVPCSDPTGISVVGATVAPKRRNVDDLIRNRRVRSIELAAQSELGKVGKSKMSAPSSGENFLSGEGIYDANLKIKLTRIYP